MNPIELARHIDHTVLRPDAQTVDIERACEVARELGCASVCVNPIHVGLARRLLEGSSVLIVGVVGFPFGATYTAVKVLETELAVHDGADEIDMVLPIGKLRDDELASVESDIAAVVRAAAGRPVKVILECGLLTDAQKREGAEIAARAGAAFVKTSTGFLGSGATVHDVTLLHEAVGARLAVKATGGIRFFEDAVALLEAGASRIGSSRTEAVLASRVDRSKVRPQAPL
jgi:deoxyribose-phosphate aldolase